MVSSLKINPNLDIRPKAKLWLDNNSDTKNQILCLIENLDKYQNKSIEYGWIYGSDGPIYRYGKASDERRLSIKCLRSSCRVAVYINKRQLLPELKRKAKKQEDGSYKTYIYFHNDSENEASHDQLLQLIKSKLLVSFSGVNSSSIARKNIKKSYRPEFFGEKELTPNTNTKAYVEHGKIVDALKEHLEKKDKKCAVYNNQRLDLGIEKNGKVTHIFEVKTSFDSQSVYTAIGQLYFHGKDLPEPSLNIVLPKNNFKLEFMKALHKINLNVYLYYLEDGNYKFNKFLVPR